MRSGRNRYIANHFDGVITICRPALMLCGRWDKSRDRARPQIGISITSEVITNDVINATQDFFSPQNNIILSTEMWSYHQPEFRSSIFFDLSLSNAVEHDSLIWYFIEPQSHPQKCRWILNISPTEQTTKSKEQTSERVKQGRRKGSRSRSCCCCCYCCCWDRE